MRERGYFETESGVDGETGFGSRKVLKHADSINDHYQLVSLINPQRDLFRVVSRSSGDEKVVHVVNKSEYSEEQLDSIGNNYEILAEFDHAHIVRLEEVFEDNERFYFVTDLAVDHIFLVNALGRWSTFMESQAAEIIR